MTLLSRFLPSLTFHLFPLARLLIVDEWSRWASQVALVVNNQSANAGDIRGTGLTPESGRSPGGGHGNPPQYSCLENPMDGGAWRATVHGVTKS